jgi:TonB family protein
MQIAKLLPQKITCILPLIVTCMISGQSLPQIDPPKDKAPLQEKKSDEKKPDIVAQGGGIEILSDTMGVDFGPYMRHLKVTVQGHWNALIPAVALPPLSKSGTVTIELAVMKDGHVRGMKVVKSSGDSQLDRAAWGGITDAIPLPTLPSEFKGDYLKLRCNFIYNPPAKQPQEAKQETKQDPKK